MPDKLMISSYADLVFPFGMALDGFLGPDLAFSWKDD
jgi:hypothetical protein